MPLSSAAGSTVCVRGLNHSFGAGENRKPALEGIELALMPGEIVIMTGPSGSGKTTLLTLIGALRRVQEGSVVVLGRELSALNTRQLVEVRRDIGIIFQGHNLFESLTARENVNLAVELIVKDARKRDALSAEILTRLGLATRMTHKPQALSGGQKQRVAVARALVNRPKLILADEPTAALDREAGREVVTLLQSMAQENQATILMVTHETRILDIADRIVNMTDGRIVSNVAVKDTVIIAEFLRQCPLFRQQPADMLAEFAQRMERIRVGPGEVIIEQGEIGDKFYIIESGVVKVTTRKGELLPTVVELATGDFFGETALLTGAPRNATVTAAGSVSLLTLAKAHFDQALQRSKSFEEQLREVLYRRG